MKYMASISFFEKNISSGITKGEILPTLIRYSYSFNFLSEITSKNDIKIFFEKLSKYSSGKVPETIIAFLSVYLLSLYNTGR